MTEEFLRAGLAHLAEAIREAAAATQDDFALCPPAPPTEAPMPTQSTRHTADTITDDALEALYAERDQLLAELAGRSEEARERWIQQQLAETGLRAADFRNGMTMEIEPARELVAHWVGAARAMLGDAPNYSETPIEMHVKVGESPERFAFVLQRVAPDALTPHQARQEAERQRDGAYRERAQLLAWLATLVPSVITPAADVYEDGWRLLFLHTPQGQLAWHIHPRDVPLFDHVQQVPDGDPRGQWDGHTTEEKYGRIRALIDCPACLAGTEHVAPGVHCPTPETHNAGCGCPTDQPPAAQLGEQAAEVVHGCPPDGSGLTPCCGRSPFELPLGDRISSEASTTCPGQGGSR